MIRAVHPSSPEEGVIYAEHLPEGVLHQARDRGWTITPTQPPSLTLPPRAEYLWTAVRRAALLPWVLNLREVVDGGQPIVELHVQGVDPERSDKWDEWCWIENALNPHGRPRVSLSRAHELLADRQEIVS